MDIHINEEENNVRASAGVSFARLAKKTMGGGLKRFQWAAGLPGTVGGAIRGNAGCFGGETKDGLVKIGVLHVQNGTVSQKELMVDELNMNYRDSMIKHHPEHIVLWAEWGVEKEESEVLERQYRERMEKKKATQPLGEQCAGSVFTRVQRSDLSKKALEKISPFINESEDVIPVSLLIDKGLGMKGQSEGGAVVSANHAGFIVNQDNATTDDILKLVEKIEQRMKQEFDIILEREIQIIGKK